MEKIEPKQDLVAISHDGFGIGVSKGQRSAETVAAVRAQRMTSPETEALSRWSGRVFIRVVTSLLRSDAINAAMNFIIVRTKMMSLLSKATLEGKENPIVVDIAGGFSPHSLFLARELPGVRIIEVDQESVVEEKKRRLKRIDIPDNLEWITADLARVPLSDVLGEVQADVITAEGLNVYFTPEEVTQIARGVHQCLKPGGVYISSISLKEGMQEVVAALNFYSRQAGRLLSIMDDEDAAKQLFTDAGYSNIELHLPRNFAEKHNLPHTPVFDIEAVIVAQKAVEVEESSSESENQLETIVEDKIEAESDGDSNTEAAVEVSVSTEAEPKVESVAEDKTPKETDSSTEPDTSSESTDA